MSALTITKVIESKDTITEEIIMREIKEALENEFNKVEISNNKDGIPELKCRVKTKLLNPIVSIRGLIKIQIKEKKAKIMIDADTKTNGWFWFTLIIGLLFWPLLLMMVYMYISQKNSSIQAFDKVFERMEFDLSEF